MFDTNEVNGYLMDLMIIIAGSNDGLFTGDSLSPFLKQRYPGVADKDYHMYIKEAIKNAMELFPHHLGMSITRVDKNVTTITVGGSYYISTTVNLDDAEITHSDKLKFAQSIAVLLMFHGGKMQHKELVSQVLELNLPFLPSPSSFTSFFSFCKKLNICSHDTKSGLVILDSRFRDPKLVQNACNNFGVDFDTFMVENYDFLPSQ
ncbi:hypothetical protein RCL1_001593 [Eukaryota sp. TZLM3-RCL]